MVSFEAVKGLANARKAKPADRPNPYDALDDSSVISDVIYRDSEPLAGKTPNQKRKGAARALSAEDKGNLSNIFAIDFASPDDSAFAPDEFDNPDLGVSSSDVYGFEDEQSSEDEKRGRLKSFFSQRKHARNRAKAERAFERYAAEGSGTTFGSDRADSSSPRAAIYEAKMGRNQKRAQKLQGTDASRRNNAGVSFSAPSGFVLPHFPKKLTVTFSTLLIVALFAGMLYAPMQQYYQQLRERDRLNAEYEAIIERNNSLQDLVDTLHSEEGVEDKAHAEFGMVKSGENSGSVTGINVQNTSKFQANIAPGSVPAPETWYSGFLDKFFFYQNGY